MRAISIHQPWAWAIVEGIKRVENRTLFQTTRGRILIHATQKRVSAHLPREVPDDLPQGAIIGRVEIVHCIHISQMTETDPLATGPYCMILESPIKCDPIPWKGQQGIFDVPDSELPAELLVPQMSKIVKSLKPSEIDWNKIAERYKAGESSQALALELGVRPQTVYHQLQSRGVQARRRRKA